MQMRAFGSRRDVRLDQVDSQRSDQVCSGISGETRYESRLVSCIGLMRLILLSCTHKKTWILIQAKEEMFCSQSSRRLHALNEIVEIRARQLDLLFRQ